MPLAPGPSNGNNGARKSPETARLHSGIAPGQKSADLVKKEMHDKAKATVQRIPLEKFPINENETKAVLLEHSLALEALRAIEKRCDNARRQLPLAKNPQDAKRNLHALEQRAQFWRQKVAPLQEDFTVMQTHLKDPNDAGKVAAQGFVDQLVTIYKEGSKVKLLQVGEEAGWSNNYLSKPRLEEALRLLWKDMEGKDVERIPMEILVSKNGIDMDKLMKSAPTVPTMNRDEAILTVLWAMTYRVDPDMQDWDKNMKLRTYFLKRENLQNFLGVFFQGPEIPRMMTRAFFVTDDGVLMPNFLVLEAEKVRDRHKMAEDVAAANRKQANATSAVPTIQEIKLPDAVTKLADELASILQKATPEQKEAIFVSVADDELKSIGKEVARLRPAGREAVKPAMDNFKKRHQYILTSKLGAEQGMILGLQTYSVMINIISSLGQMNEEMRSMFLEKLGANGVDMVQLQIWLDKWGVNNNVRGKIHLKPAPSTPTQYKKPPTVSEMAANEEKKKAAADAKRKENENYEAQLRLMEKLNRRKQEEVTREQQMVLDALSRSITTEKNGNMLDDLLDFNVSAEEWEKIPEKLQETFYNLFSVGTKQSFKTIKKQLLVEAGIKPTPEPGEPEEEDVPKPLAGLDLENYKAVIAKMELTLINLAKAVKDSFYKMSPSKALELMYDAEEENRKKALLNSNDHSVQHVIAYAKNHNGQR